MRRRAVRMAADGDGSLGEEHDVAYRRKVLLFLAERLRDRDHLSRRISRELARPDTSNETQIAALVRQLEDIDHEIRFSRFSRALSNATVSDRIIVGLRAFATFRTVEFFVSAVAFLVFGVFAYLVLTGRLFPSLTQVFGGLHIMVPAYAAGLDVSNPAHVKTAVVVLLVFVLLAVFAWFAGVAALHKNAAVRKMAMDFVKNGMAFFGGIIAGYFGRAL
jgi:hypothetical protein